MENRQNAKPLALRKYISHTLKRYRRTKTVALKMPLTGRKEVGPAPALTFTALMLCTALLLFTPQPVEALQINLQYDQNGQDAVNPCALIFDGNIFKPQYRACGAPSGLFTNHTPDLDAAMQAAADYYEDVIKDDHMVSISYWWLHPAQGSPDALVLNRDGDGKPTASRIRISVDLAYFYDPTPQDNDEFDMKPRLYRWTHPAEQAEAFNGSPPEVLEVSYNGKSFNSLNADLLTFVLHEMGHALGLSDANGVVGPGPACDEDSNSDPGYTIDLNDGGPPFGIKAFEYLDNGQAVFDCAHLAVGGINECKADPQDTVGGQFNEDSPMDGFTVGECASHQSLMWQGPFPFTRMFPGTVDLLVLKNAGGWEEIDLPRKYSAGPGFWFSEGTWLGERVPDSGDDVYIVNHVPFLVVTQVELAANTAIKSLYMSDQNKLLVSNAKLAVAETVTLGGPDTTTGPLRPTPDPPDGGGDPPIGIEPPRTTLVVDTDGKLEAQDVIVESGAVLQVLDNGKTTLGDLTNAGVIKGEGTIRLSHLSNTRIIKADGDNLKFVTPKGDPDDITIDPPLLDLDGPNYYGSPLASIQAEEGDLKFNGIVKSPVRAAITVGPDRKITFTEGWHQGYSFYPQHKLTLDGGTIRGGSTLDGVTEVHGIGRFKSTVEFEVNAVLEMGIGGFEAGPEHDQLRIQENVILAGRLAVTLTNGFIPIAGNTFKIMTYESRVGEFDYFDDLPVPDGLTALLAYGDTALTLTIGFEGGIPESNKCKGDIVQNLKDLYGNMKDATESLGFDSVKQLKKEIKKYCNG